MPNPGPATTITQEAVTSIGNYNKQGVFLLNLVPGSTAASTVTATTFVSTGIGLLVGDYVDISYTGVQTAGIGISDCYVSAADALTVRFITIGAGATPASTSPYQVNINRPLQVTSTVTTAPLLSW